MTAIKEYEVRVWNADGAMTDHYRTLETASGAKRLQAWLESKHHGGRVTVLLVPRGAKK